MTWVPIIETANHEPIAGVGPWRTYTDDEFAAIEADYDAQFPDQPGALRRWFDHVGDETPVTPAAKKKATRAVAGGESV